MTRTFTAPDTPGTTYDVTFESEYCDGFACFLRIYDAFDQSTVTINVLEPFIGSGTGLNGDYCERDSGSFDEPCTDDPDLSRVDPTVDFATGDTDWPPDGFDDDHFSVRWTGEIQAQYSQDYTFHALHDDGVRIWVDGQQVIDQYQDQDDSWTDSTTPIALERGERYPIVIEYYENAGEQDMTLAWSSASTANRTTVPESQLYPAASGTGTGLLLEYRMEDDAWDGSTGEVSDATDNARDATTVNGVQSDGDDPALAGDPGTCRYAVFDGSDQYIEDADAAGYLEGLTAVTVTAWVRNDAIGNDQGIFSTVGPQNDDNRLGLRYDSDGFFGGGNNVLKASISTTDGNHQIETESDLQSNEWQHVALVWEAGEVLRVVIDGSTVATTHADAPVGGEINNIEGLFVGQGVKSGDAYWQGELDEFRIYNDALSDTDIAGIRTETHPCTADGAPTCPADFAVYTENGLEVGNGVTVNGNAVSGSGSAIEPDTGDRSDADLDLPGFDPSTFPGFGGSQERVPPDGPTFPADDYERISLNNNQNATLDTSNGDDFRINELRLGNDSAINLEPGTYFIDALNMGNDATLSITSGTVELYIGSSFTANARASVNTSGGADGFIVRMFDGAQLQLGNEAGFTGTVYAPGSGTQIQTNDRVSIDGGIFTGGSVQLGNDSSLTYGAASEAIGRQLAQCGATTVDRYVVTAPGQGLTCVASAVSIEAQDSSGNAIDPNDGTSLALSSDTDKGTWSRVRTGSGTLNDGTTGDGAGSYTFPGDESSVVLSFDYPDIDADPEAVTVTVDDGSATGTSDPITISLAGFRFLDDDPDTTADTISGQIAAKPSDTGFGASNIGLQAIRASDDDPTTCEGVFEDGDTVSVDLGAECRDPDNCAGNNVSINGSSITTSDDNATADEPAGYSTVDLKFGPDSTAPLTFTYPDAGALRLYARHEIVFDDPAATPTSEYLHGTSNDFVVRPFGFHVSATGNPAANSAAGSVYRAAGTDFDVEIAAVGWAAGDDTDDNGVPDGYDDGDPTDNASLGDNVVLPNFGPESSDESATLNSGLWQPTGGSDPALEGTPTIDEAAFEDASDVAAGSAGTTVRYPEVGIIELRAALVDGDYLGTGFDVPGRSVAVGRFIPADFDQTASDGTFRNTCAATFTYLGETFTYQTGGLPELTITARNDGGQTTRNYTGNFAKLVAADVQRTGPTDDGTTDGSDGTPLAVIPDLRQGTLTDNGDGTLTYTFDADDGYRYERNIDRDGDGTNDARVAPFDTDLTVAIDAIEDSDGVNAPDDNRDDVMPESARIRFGRLVIESAAGAEIAPVEQVIRAEYFAGDVSGDQWNVNADDGGCTAFTLVSPNHEIELANDEDGDSPVASDDTIEIAGGTTGIQETGPIPLDSGTAVLTFGPPGAGNTGWVDTTVLLGSEHPYLAIDDDGDGVWDANPTGRVTFGIYTGPSGRILLREVPAN